MTFRTPSEAVELANNTRYGLAASVWSDNINLALDIAPKLKAGSVWINCTNLFDASSGFGGYRERGFGREGGKEGLYEYVRPKWETQQTSLEELPIVHESTSSNGSGPVQGEDGESIVQRMQTNYSMLKDVIDRARFWAGTFELQWALAGMKYNDISLSLAHIGLAREVQPVGTRLS